MAKRNLLFIAVLLGFVISMHVVSAISIVVHVPEKYTEVSAGERFYFDIEVKYPENDERKDLRITYGIVTENGELIAESKVLKAIETQASFIDFIVIPEKTKPGLHFIKVKIQDYADLSEEIEASFTVSRGNFHNITLYFFILLGTIILVGALILAVLFFREGKK